MVRMSFWLHPNIRLGRHVSKTSDERSQQQSEYCSEGSKTPSHVRPPSLWPRRSPLAPIKVTPAAERCADLISMGLSGVGKAFLRMLKTCGIEITLIDNAALIYVNDECPEFLSLPGILGEPGLGGDLSKHCRHYVEFCGLQDAEHPVFF
jgi:hypothetical protein